MSKASFNLDGFVSTVKYASLARVNRFEVLINTPPNFSPTDSRQVSLYCEVSNFPPLSLSVKPFRIFGPAYQRPVFSDYGGDGMSMTFHADRDMTIKRFFDDWVETIVDKNSFEVAYQSEYTTTILVRQLDEQNNITYEIELIEAFPRSITLMELNNSAQNQSHRINVIFGYRYWRRTDSLANRSQVRVIPIPNLQTLPVIPPIKPTPFSQALDSTNSNDGSVDFSGSAAGGIVAP